MYSKLQSLLLLGAFIIMMSSLATSETLNSTHFGLPMIYPYGNCSAVPSPQTLTFYYSNMLNYSTGLIGFIIGGSAPISFFGPLPIDDPTTMNLMTLNQEASAFHQCLQYYCDQIPDMKTIQESNQVCTESDSITAITSFIADDPTVMSLVSHKVQERVYVYSPTPIAEEVQAANANAQDNLTYEYIVLHGKSRRGTVPAVAITVPTSSECTNITITPTVDALVYRARHRDEFVNSTTANRTIEVSCLLRFEVVWIEPKINNCNRDKPKLQGTVIKSTLDVAISVAEAECNVTKSDRGFGYVGNLIHALPPVKRWGTTFITDLSHLQNQLSKERLNALFHITTRKGKEATIVFKAYITEEMRPLHSSEYKLGSDGPITIKVEEDIHTHITIQSSSPVLVEYEVCGKESGESYFSTVLQPVEWFTWQQSLLLSHSLVPQLEKYYITLVINSESEYYDITKIQIVNGNDQQSIPLVDYTPFRNGDISSFSVGISGYTIVTVAVNSEELGNNDTYILVKSVDPCTKFGASVIYHGQQSSYAHTNAYVLDEIQLADTVQCTSQLQSSRKSNDGIMYGTTSAVIVVLLLAVIIIISIGFCVRLTSTRLPPGPPHNKFEYDVFLSFADEDRSFATNYLRAPLRKKGYSVFWHYSDFIAGVTIDENIIRATKLCRRVIFVCSEHFHKSEFCQKELKYALHSHYSEYNGKYRRVIPLVVQDGECTKELQQLYPIVTRKTSDNTKEEAKKLINRLQLGKPIKDCKATKNITHNQVHEILQLQRLPPSETTYSEATHKLTFI